MNDRGELPTCKVCGEVMTNVRHWRHVYIGVDEQTRRIYFVTKEWDRTLARDPGVPACCGDRCNLILLERWLDTGSLEAPGIAKIRLRADQGCRPQ